MQSFSRLLRKLRSSSTRKEAAERMGISYSYLANLETGRRSVDEQRARQLLQQGYSLDLPQIDRWLLDIHLYDSGLHDRKLRHFVIDLSRGKLPLRFRKQLNILSDQYIKIDSCSDLLE